MHFSNTVLAMTLASAFTFIQAAPVTPADMSTGDLEEARSLLTERASTKVSTDTGSATVNLVAKRQTDIGGKADIASAVADVLTKTVNYVQGLVDADISRRQTFTQQTVGEVRAKFPTHTVVMCNVGYTFTGTALSKTGTKYKAKVGKDVTYDVLVFDKGTFTINGDGGFQNWAYVPNSNCKTAGKTITCT